MAVWTPLHRRKPVRWLMISILLVTSLIYILPSHTANSWHHTRAEPVFVQTHPSSERVRFAAFSFTGFVNTGLPGKESCDSLRRSAVIGVEKGLPLIDDTRQIASSVEDDPLVTDAYAATNDAPIQEQRKIRDSWARLAASSVWLPEHRVFLVVTRVIFYAQGNTDWPFRSWLRGQVYDAAWNHMENCTIHWQNTSTTFPTIFDIPIDYERGGIFYGPEDPRIVLEEGVDNAEPVIIYNMLTAQFGWSRLMYTYRPFSKVNTMLTIVDKDRAQTEKNWAPFFLPSDHNISTAYRQPSQYLHFVHDFSPLHILRCHLVSGDCEYDFEQTTDGGVALIRGGTNWVTLPGLEGLQTRDDRSVHAWISFPRTMVEKTCGERFYRPELMVMVKVGQSYYIAYVSAPLDFGTALVTIKASDNPCEKGRILIPNSIARWETPIDAGKPDIMTLTLSINDVSNQVMRIEGLLDFLHTLPLIQVLRESRKYGLVEDYDDLHTRLLYSKGVTLLDCSVQAAVEQATAIRILYGLPDPREEDRRKEQAEEERWGAKENDNANQQSDEAGLEDIKSEGQDQVIAHRDEKT